MFNKNKAAKKPNDTDFSALDDAVSELTKKTAALLGNAETSTKKPVLPKKQAKPAPRGKSFDIIYSPKAGGKLQSKLRTVSAADAPLLDEQEHLLLSDHAGLSFNEQDNQASGNQSVVTAEARTVPAIINHREGKLDTAHDQPDKLAEDTDPEPETQDETSAAIEEAKSDPVDLPKSTAQTAVSFAEDTEDTVEAQKEAAKKPDDSPEPESTASDEESEHSVQSPEDNAYKSGELFANNLVKPKERKGYEPHENQQKPTVFDTNEYHPQLHDWSKLEHRSGPKVLVLLLLLVVGGALAYFVISGASLPF